MTDTDWGECFTDILDDEATWFGERVAPWFGVLSICTIGLCFCCCCFLLFNYCMTSKRNRSPSSTERATYQLFFFLLTLGVFTLFVFLYLNAFNITNNLNDILDAVEDQGGRFYSLAQVANNSADYLMNSSDISTINDLFNTVESASHDINSTTHYTMKVAIGIRDTFMILCAIPALLLIIAMFSMFFKLFFLLRMFTVIILLYMFLFSLLCVTTSLPYAVSNHFCDEFQDILAEKTDAFPSSCNINSTVLNNLNMCLLQNETSSIILDNLDLEGVLSNIQSTLISDTNSLNQQIAVRCPKYPPLNPFYLYAVRWSNASEIDQSESYLSLFEASVSSFISNISLVCTPTYQTLLRNNANDVLQISFGFGAILDVVNCGPLSSFYETTVVTSFCQSFNHNLLWISIYTAGVIALLIPVAMIAFATGFRPWRDGERLITDPPTVIVYNGEPIYRPILEPSAPPAINQDPLIVSDQIYL